MQELAELVDSLNEAHNSFDYAFFDDKNGAAYLITNSGHYIKCSETTDYMEVKEAIARHNIQAALVEAGIETRNGKVPSAKEVLTDAMHS